MKKIFLLLAFILNYAVQSQDISPSPYNEYCPNQEYIFTISNVASQNSSGIPVTPQITPQGGVLSAQYISFYDNKVTVRVIFSDTNTDQSFKLESASGSITFTFRNVKSFFGGYSESNITSVNVPLCNTNPFTISLGGTYRHANNFSYSNFGLITKFNYRIPAGWRINGQLSTGSNTFLYWGEVTITPDATTGGTIWYQALGDCGQAYYQGDAAGKYISINRGVPTYTLSPTSLKFACGTAKTQTFTVTQTGTTTCPVSYVWNLGANNGWLYNGTTAPSSITTTTASITLTSANGNVLPSSITVSPKLGTTTITNLNCTTSLESFSTNATLSGNSIICNGSNGIYTINGLGTGNTVVWSSSNTAVATVSGSTQSQVTVDGLTNGTANLIATITNSCGQTVTKTQTINVGAPVLTGNVVRGELWVRKSFYPQTLTFPAVQGATSYNWVLTPDTIDNFPPVCPATGAVPAKFNNNLLTITTTTPSATASFGNCLGNYTVTCMVSNICGSTTAYEIYVTVGNSGNSPCFAQNTYSKAFTITQNPIKNGDIKIRKNSSLQIEEADLGDDIPTSNILNGDQPCYIEWPKVYNGLKMNNNQPKNLKSNPQVEIKIFDFFGKQVYTKTIDSLKEEISIKDSNLISGKYILHINDGVNTQKEIIIIE